MSWVTRHNSSVVKYCLFWGAAFVLENNVAGEIQTIVWPCTFIFLHTPFKYMCVNIVWLHVVAIVTVIKRVNMFISYRYSKVRDRCGRNLLHRALLKSKGDMVVYMVETFPNLINERDSVSLNYDLLYKSYMYIYVYEFDICVTLKWSNNTMNGWLRLSYINRMCILIYKMIEHPVNV